MLNAEPETLLLGAVVISSGRIVPLPAAGDSADGSRVVPVTPTQVTLARTFIVVTLIVQVIALLTFGARVWTRMLPKWRFKVDDWLMCIAFVLMTIMFCLQWATQTWVIASPDLTYHNLSALSHAMKLGAISLPFWGWATGLVKISIGCMLLRFQQGTPGRLLIIGMIFLNVLLIIFAGIVQMFQCVPYASVWDFTGKYRDIKKCWSSDISVGLLYATCVCNIVSDVVFSIMPLSFLGRIRRPLREKVVVGSLMALGLLASIFSLCRMIIQARGRNKKDPIACLVLSCFLICLEVQVSLIAACVPTLRSSGRRALIRMGLMKDESVTEEGLSSATVGRKRVRRVVELHEVEIQEIETARTVERNTVVSRARSEARTNETGWYSDEDTDNEEDLEDLVMDPVTGRIMRRGDVREQSSMTQLNEDWKAIPGSHQIGVAK